MNKIHRQYLPFIFFGMVLFFVQGNSYGVVTASEAVTAIPVVADSAAYSDESEAAVRFTVISNESIARYLVREQLAGFDFPNDAVGETNNVIGAIAFDEDGAVLSDESRIVVNITGLTSDSERRDRYIQRNTLEGETYPTVELVPFQTRGLTFPLPTNSTITFDIVGNLTVRDVTEATSWRVTAQFGESELTGTARTEFTFDEFGLEKPSVGSVLSVADAIRLEFDFKLIVENTPGG